jgi:exopolyphosphatase/guanosine-5'-triphosphate,3'-diphosphate pyrophosphatase
VNVAAVDIGTNSARLLITDHGGRELERRMHITRLGEGVDATGALGQSAIERTVAVLSEYGAAIAKHSVERVRAVATSAARDARNSRDFFDAAETALGTRPELLSGETEALLSFRGATAELPGDTGPFLVIDIGGGSTEFVLGHAEPQAAISLNVGCVRLSERHLASDPPSSAELEACLSDVGAELARVRAVLDPKQARLVVGLAGTVTALSALHLGLERYDAVRTHHSRLSRTTVEALFGRLSKSTLAQRRALLVEPARASSIVGGAAVLVRILRDLELDELLVSEHDILDGLAASLRVSRD